ncbi:MAG: hypothetical protein GXY08_11385, partial [Ruminococcus sp.]|nr:hypothetical protein [Ruminococcus sp.]
MRLPLKIGAIVLAPILTAALVIFIFFPGLFTYIKVKFKYENIDRTIPTFDLVWIPDDFEEYSGSDIILLAPADMKDVSTKMPYGTKYKSSTTKYQKGKQTVMIIDQNDIYDRMEYDPWDNEKYDKKDYRHFFESIDHDFPSIL